MFGKSLSEYVRFQSVVLVAIGLVWAARLAASLSGMERTQVRWVSITLVLLIGLVYASIAVHTRQFGAYKQLFGLLLVQNVMGHILIAVGIALAVLSGIDNIYTAPEYFGGDDGKNWLHVVSHVIAGPFAAFFLWLIGCIFLFITRKFSGVTYSTSG